VLVSAGTFVVVGLTTSDTVSAVVVVEVGTGVVFGVSDDEEPFIGNVVVSADDADVGVVVLWALFELAALIEYNWANC
jgi:hypothetical protein